MQITYRIASPRSGTAAVPPAGRVVWSTGEQATSGAVSAALSPFQTLAAGAGVDHLPALVADLGRTADPHHVEPTHPVAAHHRPPRGAAGRVGAVLRLGLA